MKLKQNLLSLFVFLHLQQTSPASHGFSESQLESWRVVRKSDRDDFFLKMKPSSRCLHEWCQSEFASTYITGSVQGSYESCGCYCESFIPSMQRCSDPTLAASFGECNSYFDQGNPLEKIPVDLTRAKQNYKIVSLSNASNCVVKGMYFDYHGFQKSWRYIPEGFFNLTRAQGANPNFFLGWQENTAVSDKLSGRIIRLNVTCNNFQSCWLLKALGTVTYNATVSSSTSSTHTIASQSSIDIQVPLLSKTSLFVSRSITSQSPQLPLSSLSSSLSSSSSSSSLLSSSSVVLSTHSAVSLSPSLVVTSLLQPSSTQTTRLPTMSTPGKMKPTSEVELQSLSSFNSDGFHTSSTRVVQPIEPSKTTSTAVSGSSTAGIDDPGGRETQTGGNDEGVVIGTAVGGALALGAVVIVIVFVFRKRRRAEKSPGKDPKQVKNPVYGTSINEIPLEKSKGSQIMPPSVQDNQELYQGLTISSENSNATAIYSNPEDDYDNCNVYQSLEKEKPGSPVYQGLNASQGKTAHTTGLPKNSPRTSISGPLNSKAKLATGMPKAKPQATGNPYQKPIVTSEPVYNVLERQDGEEDYEASNVDSLYDVLEGPDATYESSEKVLEDSVVESDLVYNVLEEAEAHQKPPESGPSAGQEPLYNVLEDSDAGKDPLIQQSSSDLQDEPVYNVLEESDSGAGPSKPHPLSGHDNPAYEQTLQFEEPYAAVHKPGSQRESLYEPLREPSQDLYAPLG